MSEPPAPPLKLKPLGARQPGVSSKIDRRKLPRLLYVEDEDVNWKLTEAGLRDRYQLARAATSRETFAAVLQSEFDAILMDIQLKGSELNGIEITKVFRGRHHGSKPAYAADVPPWVARVPIIFVTAYTVRYSAKDLIEEAGGSGLLAKPVSFQALALIISRAVSANVRGERLPGLSTEDPAAV